MPVHCTETDVFTVLLEVTEAELSHLSGVRCVWSHSLGRHCAPPHSVCNQEVQWLVHALGQWRPTEKSTLVYTRKVP